MKKTNKSLRLAEWAVIAHHYVRQNLTYDEALAEAKDLRARKQPGVVIVTNEAAQRMIDSAAGAKSADASDVRF